MRFSKQFMPLFFITVLLPVVCTMSSADIIEDQNRKFLDTWKGLVDAHQHLSIENMKIRLLQMEWSNAILRSPLPQWKIADSRFISTVQSRIKAMKLPNPGPVYTGFITWHRHQFDLITQTRNDQIHPGIEKMVERLYAIINQIDTDKSTAYLNWHALYELYARGKAKPQITFTLKPATKQETVYSRDFKVNGGHKTSINPVGTFFALLDRDPVPLPWALNEETPHPLCYTVLYYDEGADKYTSGYFRVN